MLIVTANDIPGWEIQRVCGDAFGLAVRQTSAAGLGSVGVNLKVTLGNLAHIRKGARAQLVEEARALGGNAIVALRFDTSELGKMYTEVCAYGTAVQAVPVTEAAKYTAQQLGYGPQSSAAATGA